MSKDNVNECEDNDNILVLIDCEFKKERIMIMT